MKKKMETLVLILFGITNTLAQQSEANQTSMTDTMQVVSSLEGIEVIAPKVQYKSGSAKNGYRIDTVSVGLMGDDYIQKAPYFIGVTSSEMMENQGSHTLLSALKTNPTVAPDLAPNTDQRGLSNTSIRGFSPNYLLDGLPVNSYHMPSLSMVDHIEVINGFSSFFYGFQNFGGNINFIPKKPTENSQASFSAGIYNGGVNYVQGDIGGPVDSAGIFSYRFNAFKESGETYIDDQRQDNGNYAGVLRWHPFDKTTVDINAYHQDYRVDGLQTPIAMSSSVPDADIMDASELYGQSWTWAEMHLTQIGASITSQLSPIFRLRTAYLYGKGFWQYNYILASFGDDEGNYSETDYQYGPQDRDYHAGHAMLDMDFSTGRLDHRLTLGYVGNATLIHFTNVTGSWALGSSNVSYPLRVTAPDSAAVIPTGYDNYNRYFYHTILFGDRISLGEHFDALLGISENVYHTIRTTGNLSQSGSADYSQKKLSPTLALTFTPWKPISTYVSYAQGLAVGGTAPDAAQNAGEILDPSASTQMELGVKSSLGKLQASASLFRTEVMNEYIDPSDSVYKQDGREVHQGVELSLTGNIFPSLTLSGGVTRMSAEVEKAENNTALEGKTPQNVPEAMAKVYLEYRFPWIFSGLAVSAGANYTGRRPVNAANTDFIPSIMTFDAGLRYRMNFPSDHFTTFTLNVTNLTDETYWESCNSSGLRLGSPRLVAFAVKVEI